MRKKHHIFFIANISLLLIAIILGLVFQGSISDCGISHLSNIKDVEDSHIVLNYAWNENDEGGLTLTSFGSDVDLYGVASAEIIAVVAPTGNIIQTEGSIGQEFTVKEIIKGDASLSVGNTAYGSIPCIRAEFQMGPCVSLSESHNRFSKAPKKYITLPPLCIFEYKSAKVFS